MLSTDRDALLCDLAETYRVYGLNTLPASTIAMLAVGLRDGSRIKKKLSNIDYDINNYLLASIADRLGLIYAWLVGASPGDVESLADIIAGVPPKQKKLGATVFDSVEEFEAAREKIMKE